MTTSERDFMAQVLDVARLLGWRPYHTRDSRRSAPGFPDLVMVRPPRAMFVELKRDNGKPTTEQTEWLDLLGRCIGVESYLWRPGDWDVIVRCLQ